MDELDKKIGENYYTFVDGVMQTGWYKFRKFRLLLQPLLLPMPKFFLIILLITAQITMLLHLLPAISTMKKTENALLAGMRFTAQKASVMMIETYRFYFKKGVPLAASAGVQIFTVNSKQYAFNMRGEMQTGKQVITTENGQTANAYFAEDGVMKTGKQAITDEESGVTEYWYFHTDGSKKGHGFSGIQDNRLYIEGRRRIADAELALRSC